MTTTDEPSPTGRRNTYVTDAREARARANRAPNQKMKLLIQYWEADNNGTGPINDEEAASAAGLLASCWWKRCGELRADGFIEQPVDRPTRTGSAGVERILCQITPGGTAYLDALKLLP